MIHKSEGFDSLDFIKNVILKVLPPVFVSAIICVLITINFETTLRFILTYLITIPAFAISVFYFSLNKTEQNKVITICNSIRNRIRK